MLCFRCKVLPPAMRPIQCSKAFHGFNSSAFQSFICCNPPVFSNHRLSSCYSFTSSLQLVAFVCIFNSCPFISFAFPTMFLSKGFLFPPFAFKSLHSSYCYDVARSTKQCTATLSHSTAAILQASNLRLPLASGQTRFITPQSGFDIMPLGSLACTLAQCFYLFWFKTPMQPNIIFKLKHPKFCLYNNALFQEIHFKASLSHLSRNSGDEALMAFVHVTAALLRRP